MRTLALAAVVLLGLVVADPVHPDDDGFYDAPEDYALRAIGEILKSREVPSPLAGLTYKTAYQLMYRSVDSIGMPTYGITTVIVPTNGDGTQVVSYHQAEDASYIGCAPSYTMQMGSGDPSIQALLDFGFYVNTPDYEGPESEFTAGIQAGQSTLDSIRAVLSSGDLTGASSDARVALWGYSGGSVATGWAAQLAPQYAPDLSDNLVAGAMGGVVANVSAVAENVNGGMNSGFLPSGLFGLAAAYPELKDLFEEQLLPNGTALQSALKQCVVANLIEFYNQDIFSYFRDGHAVMYHPLMQAVFDEITMGASAPQIPFFFYNGIVDEVVPVAIVDELASDWCSAGVSIYYAKGPGLGHIDAASNAQEAVLSYLSSAVAGANTQSGCTTTTTLFSASMSHSNTPSSTIVTANVTFSSFLSSTATPSSSSVSAGLTMTCATCTGSDSAATMGPSGSATVSTGSASWINNSTKQYSQSCSSVIDTGITTTMPPVSNPWSYTGSLGLHTLTTSGAPDPTAPVSCDGGSSGASVNRHTTTVVVSCKACDSEQPKGSSTPLSGRPTPVPTADLTPDLSPVGSLAASGSVQSSPEMSDQPATILPATGSASHNSLISWELVLILAAYFVF